MSETKEEIFNNLDGNGKYYPTYDMIYAAMQDYADQETQPLHDRINELAVLLEEERRKQK